MTGLTDWIEIFKTGKHPGTGALAQAAFTATDLDQIVSNFNPAQPVPHVITHKELYSPFAYAQAVELKREGDSLWARSERVNPQFEQLVREGNLYNRSIRIYQTDKGYELGHIAWLGAEPPAVAGLAPVEFSACPAFADYTIRPLGQDTGEKPMGEFTKEQLDAAKAEAAQAAEAKAKAEFAAEKTAAEQREAALKAELLVERRNQAKGEWEAKIKTAQAEGRLTPAQAEGAADFALSLPEAVLEYSKGEGKEVVKTAPRQWFADFIAKLPKQVALASDAQQGGSEANDWKGDAVAIAARAGEYQAAQKLKGIEVGAADAVIHVTGANQ
jgi:hypothetical protein